MKLIRDVMTSDVEIVSPNTSIFEAAEKMKKLDIGMLPVCGEDRLIGTITDRDIAIRAVSANCYPEQTRVRDVMTHDIVFCYEDEPIQNVAQLMQSRQIRRVVILNREKRLCGIVSLGDLAVEAKRERLTEETLEKVSKTTFTHKIGRRFYFKQGRLVFLSTLVGTAAFVGGYQLFKKQSSEKSTQNLGKTIGKAA